MFLRHFDVIVTNEVTKNHRFVDIVQLLDNEYSLIFCIVLCTFDTFDSAINTFDNHNIFNIQQFYIAELSIVL